LIAFPAAWLVLLPTAWQDVRADEMPASLWLALSWGGGNAPTLAPAAQEALPTGPTAIAVSGNAVSGTTVWIADPADSEVLRVAPDGKVHGLAAPFAALDIAVSGTGQVALLSEALDRVATRDEGSRAAGREAAETGGGKWRIINLPEGGARRLAWGPDGALWVETSDGLAAKVDHGPSAVEEGGGSFVEEGEGSFVEEGGGSFVEEGEGSGIGADLRFCRGTSTRSSTRSVTAGPDAGAGERALPLAGAPAHALARVEGDVGVVWVFPFDEEARLKSPRARRVEVRLGGALGTVRPLAHAPDGRLDVLAEVLSGNNTVDVDRVEVVRNVVTYDKDGKQVARLTFPGEDVAPVYKPAAVSDDGTLYVMVSSEAGVKLYRLPADGRAAASEVRP